MLSKVIESIQSTKLIHYPGLHDYLKTIESLQGQPLIQYAGLQEDYIPSPKQWLFHLLPVKNLLIGGVRGTGKSICMRNDAHFRAMRQPGFTYLILRRKFPDLHKNHLRFLNAEMEALQGYYHETRREAIYGNGSIGYFGHVENDSDVENYQGSEFGAIYFDELPFFTFEMFNKISGSARVKKSAGYSPIVRAAGNPGGPYEDWVMEYFINQSATSAGYDSTNYEYIHTVQGDNPHIAVDYYENLAAENPHLRRQWAFGEWGVQEEGYFPEFRPWQDEQDGQPCEPFPWHVINELPTVNGKPLLQQPWINIYRAVDWGFHPDPAVCLWIAVLPNKQAIAFKERTWRQTPAVDVAKDIVADSQGMRVVDTFADPSMWTDSIRATGMSIADYYEANGVPLSKSVNDRRGAAIHEWLNTLIEGRPKLQIYREGCPQLIKTLPQMRINETDPEKIADGPDHWVIALSYFCRSDIAVSKDRRYFESSVRQFADEHGFIPREWTPPRKKPSRTFTR